MGIHSGWVAERRLILGEQGALIACPPQAVPAAGQYVLAVDEQSVLSVPLFQVGESKQGFLTSALLPKSWQPGTALTLYGPLGNGFNLPIGVQRLALVALGESDARLLSLATAYPQQDISVTLFSDAPAPNLPPSLEAYPLDDLPDSADWADFMAFDVPLQSLERLAGLLESFQEMPDSRGQVFIQADMPCGGLGDCGVCAIKAGRTWKLACKDGPVFKLEAIVKGIGT
jgi:dihydroorotate dehydrogenase electron transfer subunit